MKKILRKLFPSPAKFEDRTVLIVDDSEVDRKLIAKTLMKMGCRVLTAVDGEIGLHIALSETPDLILSDCHMPNMDGVEMCRELKNTDETKEIPVIFLTGDTSPSKVVDCFELNVDNYMCKPINSKVLMSQIEDILTEHLPSVN